MANSIKLRNKKSKIKTKKEENINKDKTKIKGINKA